MTYKHQPVLLTEVIEGLAIKPEGVYMDLTFGRGGHSQAILKSLGPEGRLVAMDKDPAAIQEGERGSFFNDPRFTIQHASFSEMKNVIEEMGLQQKVNGILMDLGVSSPQLDDPERGFSFTREGPLDMRMNPQQGMDAATWLNQASMKEIMHVLREYGEERFARRIATAIVSEREEHALTTTLQLAQLIERAVPRREKRIHPATRSFQAIRIFINRELEELKECLAQCLEMMSVGGRLCVISFHSLEDRIVKRFFQREARGDEYPPGLPIPDVQLCRRLKIIASIKATQEEVEQNVRSRSARLRIAEKLQ
jgi:16S rRNA (cytosine1402-N4)-methyltransferase